MEAVCEDHMSESSTKWRLHLRQPVPLRIEILFL